MEIEDFIRKAEKEMRLSYKQVLFFSLVDGENNDPLVFPKTEKLIRGCFNSLCPEELMMEQYNEILEGFGVEAIRGDYVDDYHMDIVATYVNMGDLYVPTIIRDNVRKEFLIMSWGDFVEKNNL